MRISLGLFVLSTLVSPLSAAIITPGADFNLDASLDTDGDSRWEDTVAGNPSGFDALLDTANGVVRNTGVSNLPGIKAAYSFPGGFTAANDDPAGAQGGARITTTDTTTYRSFHHAPGDWSNENVTIETWIRPDNIDPSPSNGQIVFEDGGGTGIGIFVDDNLIVLRQRGGVGSTVGQRTYNIDTDPLNLLPDSPIDEFFQVVGVFDRGNTSLQLYINGVLANGTDGSTGNDWSGGDSAALGTRGGENTGGYGDNQQNTESYDGEIAIFRIYRNALLTPGQIQQNYLAVSTPEPSTYVVFAGLAFCFGMARWWRRRRHQAG